MVVVTVSTAQVGRVAVDRERLTGQLTRVAVAVVQDSFQTATPMVDQVLS